MDKIKLLLYLRYFKNQFNDNFLTIIGIIKGIKLVKIGNEIYKIKI